MASAWVIRAARAVRAGGVIGYPTEAVYGLGCDPANTAALLRLLKLKRRSANKGLILIAADIRQLRPWLAPLSDDLLARIDATWPGPVTWLLPARAGVSALLRGRHRTLAVRVTAHPVAAALCRAADRALVSTSANISGRAAIRDPLELRLRFGHRVDVIVPGPLGDRPRPTEIRDRNGAIVRAG